MLEYSRCKSVGVQRQGEDRRVVSGVLEDELYAMACEISVDWPSLTIESVQTRMKRFTTGRCPRAKDVFTRAEGWKIDSELDGKIKKEIGRYGCRHMAILMVDCCRALARAELARELKAALENTPDLDRRSFVEDFHQRYPDLRGYLQLR
ncbi:MAG: DUF2889 domain-containing protein [Desulfomonilaceae bacterium]|nr:DUF2889 domain-containing protein [Desulfomonilaceae bacterium]